MSNTITQCTTVRRHVRVNGRVGHQQQQHKMNLKNEPDFTLEIRLSILMMLYTIKTIKHWVPIQMQKCF